MSDRSMRLAENLTCRFADVVDEALMMSMRDLCVSSGSACTSKNPEPNHVLRALELSNDTARDSLRLGLGRFYTADEVDFAIDMLAESVHRLRSMSSLAEALVTLFGTEVSENTRED